MPLTFKNPRIVYYGPHECHKCGVLIARAGDEYGGAAFTYPEGAIYPNTIWQTHFCDPLRVADKI